MSLKTIAQMTHTSVSTVSRVLNGKNSKCASKKLKDEIWSAARKIGYLPNENARALKRGNAEPDVSYSVTVICFRRTSIDEDPFFAELFRSLEEELLRERCRIDLIVGSMKSEIIKIKASDGVIIIGRCAADDLRQIKNLNPCVIGLWRNPMECEIDQVFCSGKKAAHSAVNYLASLGHKNIAYIGDCSAEGRFVGYTQALLSNQIPISLNWVYETDQSFKEGYEAADDILSKSAVSAALCANDLTALGVLDRFANEKKRRQISVISIDNIEAAESAPCALTTYNIPRRDMAHIGVKILIDRIMHGHREYLSVELPARLVERESVSVFDAAHS